MIRLIKILDISIIGTLYFFIGLTVSYLLSKYIMKKYDSYEKEKITKDEIILRLIFEVSVLTISVYLVRIFIKYLNSNFNPLEGIEGFDTNRLKELNGTVVLAFTFIFFLKDSLGQKINILYS